MASDWRPTISNMCASKRNMGTARFTSFEGLNKEGVFIVQGLHFGSPDAALPVKFTSV